MSAHPSRGGATTLNVSRPMNDHYNKGQCKSAVLVAVSNKIPRAPPHFPIPSQIDVVMKTHGFFLPLKFISFESLGGNWWT